MAAVYEDAKASLLRREHVVGAVSKYYIVTIKNHNNHYGVLILEGDEIIAQEESFDRLEGTKEKGMGMLLAKRSDATPANTSLVHYKADRNNGNPWVKDIDAILEKVFKVVQDKPLQSIDHKKLNQLLKQFTGYRQDNEADYLSQERSYKVDFFAVLGEILRQIESNPSKAKSRLLELISKKQGESIHVRWWDNLISPMTGFSQRDDFQVLLENVDTEEFESIFTSMFEEGITAEVRTRINDRLKSLFEQGKMAASKKSVSYPSVQFLAVFLAAYASDEYTLYKSTQYTDFARLIGLAPENDALKKYRLFNQMSHYILGFAQEHGYRVDDLIDVHNLIYLYSKPDEQKQDEQKQDEEPQGAKQPMSKPQNRILYGPPGTGKTYNIINHALKILVPEIDLSMLSRREVVAMYSKFVENNQVMFCTFHQSFSYEDFVEGIRFDKESEGYLVRDGVFKRICNAAKATVVERKNTYDFDTEKTKFFKMSLGYIYDTEDDIFDYCIENNVIALGWGDEVDYSDCDDKESIKKAFLQKYPTGKIFAIEAMQRFKNRMKPGHIVVITSGNTKARAIGKVTGEYTFNPDISEGYMHFRAVEWLYVDNLTMLPVERILKQKNFSQQTIYMLDDNDLNMDSLQELIAGKKPQSSGETQYVLIIDEINRGNISKIFGELITLIEPDKRIGQPNELTVTLPYSEASGVKFGVPSNVHLLGTMNTADRSIALLDTALRRRFEFIEMMPDYDVLPDNVDGVNIQLMLKTINDRIEYLYDRDHVIGHAYFLADNPSLEYYKKVMKEKIIPLLQEYFYESWESVALVLGGAAKPNKNDPDFFLNSTLLKPDGLFGDSSEVPDMPKNRYTVHPNPTNKALSRIYEKLLRAEGSEDEVEDQDDET